MDHIPENRTQRSVRLVCSSNHKPREPGFLSHPFQMSQAFPDFLCFVFFFHVERINGRLENTISIVSTWPIPVIIIKSHLVFFGITYCIFVAYDGYFWISTLLCAFGMFEVLASQGPRSLELHIKLARRIRIPVGYSLERSVSGNFCRNIPRAGGS